MRLARLIIFLLFPLLAGLARAQSVRWEPADSGVSQAAMLVFEDCAPDGEPQLPAVPGVTFTRVGQSSNTSIVNGAVTRSIVLSYLIRSRQSGPVTIPAFTVKTDKGPRPVAAFNAAAPAAPVESFASARLIPERTSVWAGEVFGLGYELSASRRTNPQIQPVFEWNSAPLVAEDWSKPEINDAAVGNDRRVVVSFRTRAIARTPNTQKLEAATHFLTVQTGTIGFGFLSQPRMEQVSVTSDQPVIEVRPLPAAPPGFSGAVGQFKLVSTVVPEKAAIGEPVTWTLELSGGGNWPDLAALPAREVSNDFQVVQPKAKRTPAEGKLFDATLSEDVVLVPAKAGTYTLGPVTFTYFDPKAGAYKTITAPKTSVTITGPVAPRFAITPTPGNDETRTPKTDGTKETDTTSTTPKKAPVAPPPPGAIPRDPLPGAGDASTPLATRDFLLLLLAPFALALACWAFLAARRAHATDPARPRREARERLARLLAEMSASETSRLPPPASRLLEWQHDTAVLRQLHHAAPRAEALGDATWAALWAEADRALYGAKTELPADWVPRARAALAAQRVPGFNPLRLFLPRNLLPFAASLALLLGAGAVLLRAAEPAGLAAYRKGDFAAAEKSWRAAVAKNPADWIARHNLALALAQQTRAPEAAAHSAAAFVQNPAHPAVRWQFRHGSEHTGTAPGPLLAFVTPDALHTLAEHHSPATWQTIAIGAAGLAALALVALLTWAYGLRGRAWIAGSLTVVVLALLVAGTAIAGWSAYGEAADPAAVIVARAGTLRSIPTEADTTQKTTPLAAGSLAIAEKDLLGWTRLRFAQGQTGWVRKEELVPVWK
ncbi:MAG: BatD family protein [Opitutaceae bacterium]|nr:BatD family protein [Opitutaceae bacterium]